MAEHPFNVSRKLFKWLDLPWVTEVEQYISDHTTVNEERSDSTHRQLRTRIARWRNDTNWKYNKDAATACQEVLHSFGYLVLGNLTYYSNNCSDNVDTHHETFLHNKLEFNYLK